MTLPAAKVASQARACVESVSMLLRETLDSGAPADRLLGAYLRENRRFGGRDRRLIGDLFFGALRWWGWLRPLAPTGDTPGTTPDPEAWAPFLLGAAVLEGMGDLPVCRVWEEQAGLPPDAVPTASGPPSPDARGEFFGRFPGGECAVRGLPRDLVPEWAFAEIRSPIPPDEVVARLQERPPVWLRVREDVIGTVRRELLRDGLETIPHPRLAGALQVTARRLNLDAYAAYRDGRLEVQDLASQAIGRICAPRPGEYWWDACAGAGGKSLHLACLMDNRGRVEATDIRPGALRELERRSRRAGLAIIRCGIWQGERQPQSAPACDGVLVDAPCSCSGTWRRNPGARWTLRREEIGRYAARQQALLRAAADRVRPGGSLIYATCSLFARENEDVVLAFLAERKEFSLAPFTDPLDGRACDGMRLTGFGEADCDAMFAARMVRRPSGGT